MNRKILLVLAFVLVFTLGGFTFPQKNQTQYEYKFEYDIREKKANELGSQGWELVGIGACGEGAGCNVTVFVFKRAK